MIMMMMNVGMRIDMISVMRMMMMMLSMRMYKDDDNIKIFYYHYYFLLLILLLFLLMIGTLMKDILKVFSRFRLDHHQQIISIHLVELSQTLRVKQYQELVGGTHSKKNHNQSMDGESKMDQSDVSRISSSSSSSSSSSIQLNTSSDGNDNDDNDDSSIARNIANKNHQDNVDAGSNVIIKDSQGYESTIYPGITIHWHSFLNQVPGDAPDLIIG